MRRIGRVARVDIAAGTATVDLQAPGPDNIAGCARCARGLGCQALFGGTPRPMRIGCRLPADVQADALVDRPVTVQFPDSDRGPAWVIALGYGLPTSGLVLGCLIADFAAVAGDGTNPDTLATLGGLCGLALGLLLSLGALRAREAVSVARPCHDAPRIVSVATTPLPILDDSHADDHSA